MSSRSARRSGAQPPGTVQRIRDIVRGTVLIRRGFDLPVVPGALAADRAVAARWTSIVRTLFSLGGTSSGNAVTIFCDGDQKFEELWRCLATAGHSIWFEMYTLEPDRVGQRTLEELTAAARRGCEVRLLYDAVGSSGLTNAALQPLREAGADIVVFNPLRWLGRKMPFLRRDHRKIVIIDGVVGFCGGMNVSEQYAGTTYGNNRFRDCHLKLEGPGVRDLAVVLASSWTMMTDRRLHVPPAPPAVGETFLQILGSRGAQGRRSIQRSIRVTVRNALRHCYITTPYFVPPQRLISAMTRAAERGVDVRVLTAGDSDVPIVRAAAQHIYGVLLRKGVRIFEMFERTLHAKSITIDGLYGTVGSFNLDYWSHQRNLEVNAAMLDPKIAAELETRFFADLAQSHEVTLDTWQRRSWPRRLLNWAAYHLMRL